MKKKVLIDKFALYAFQFKARSEFLFAAWRVLHDLGIEDGINIEDFDNSDFDGTGVYYKRRDQISKIAEKNKSLSSSMLIDYIMFVGKKYIDEIKNKTKDDRENKDGESKTVMRNFMITKRTLDRFQEFAEKTGKTQTEVAEAAINYYCDLDDSEK